MPRLLVWLAASALVAGSVAVGALAADAFDTTPAPALPALGAPAPVIPADEPADAPPTDGGGTGSGGGSVDALAPIAPVSVLSPTPLGTDAPTLPTTPDLTDVPAPATHEDPPPGFGDPCAEGGEGCDGVGATVLGVGEPRPMQIVAVRAGICDLGPDSQPPADGTPFQIIANTPGRFTLYITDPMPADVEIIEPVHVTSGVGTTAPHEVADWEASGHASFVSTCVGAGVPNRDHRYNVHVEGFFEDSSDSYDTTLDATVQNRPPVVIELPSLTREDQLHVIVPAKSGADRPDVDDRTGVSVVFSADASCTTYHGSPSLDELSPTSPVLSRALEAPGYPYDPAYDHRFEQTYESLEANTTYHLCIVWYEAGTAIERVEYRMQSPSRYSIVARVQRIDFPDTRQVPRNYSVSMFGGQCVIPLSGSDPVHHRVYGSTVDDAAHLLGTSAGCTHRGLEPIPGPFLRSSGPTHDDVSLEVVVHGPGGIEATSFIEIPFSPCLQPSGCDAPDRVRVIRNDFIGSETEVPSARSYRVPLSVVVGLCGSGTGGGCDPPTSRLAVVTLSVKLIVEHRRPVGSLPASTGTWDFGAPTPWQPEGADL